jgi:dipeptide/tripeptide permease
MDDGEPSEQNALTKLFGSFPRQFWVINAFELFERGAYYGTMAVLAYHVVNNLMISRVVWGTLYSFLIILLYFIPLFAAALASKFGYKQTLIVAFGLMVVGYTSLTMVQAEQFPFLVAAFLMVGIGAGIFKPIISASIAHVTPEDQRNLAYSIYYWMINLGAVISPFIIGFMFSDTGLYYYVYLISTGLVVVNLIILFILFRNPIEPQPDMKISHALMRIVPALRDKWFVVLLFIYSGFWFMFAYNHTFLPLLMTDFARMPAAFTVPFLATINPGTIVLLGPFLGKLVEKYKSLNVMMFGMVIFCIGFALNGMSNSQSLFIAGIIIFSIGEFIVHPGFISYVSKIAPKDKVAIYLACIFLSTGLGQLVGGFTQGALYDYFGYQLQRPQVYIALVITVGILTLFAFMVYNKRQIRETLKADPDSDVDQGIWTKPTTMVVALLFIPVAVWGGYSGGELPIFVDEDEGPKIIDWTEYDIRSVDLGGQSDRSNENSNTPVQVAIDPPNVRSVTFTLTWQDEPDATFRHTNEPDTFSLEVFPPNATEVTSPTSTTGSVSVTITYDPGTRDPYFNGTGLYDVTVICGNCGDQEPILNILNLRSQADTGNTWSLRVSVDIYVQPGL